MHIKLLSIQPWSTFVVVCTVRALTHFSFIVKHALKEIDIYIYHTIVPTFYMVVPTIPF